MESPAHRAAALRRHARSMSALEKAAPGFASRATALRLLAARGGWRARVARPKPRAVAGTVPARVGSAGPLRGRGWPGRERARPLPLCPGPAPPCPAPPARVSPATAGQQAERRGRRAHEEAPPAAAPGTTQTPSRERRSPRHHCQVCGVGAQSRTVAAVRRPALPPARPARSPGSGLRNLESRAPGPRLQQPRSSSLRPSTPPAGRWLMS